VASFGHEWNTFNFIDFKTHWLVHTVKNTFGSTAVFKGKVVVDAGAGSGSQSKWISEAGADHVIALELSGSVDDVMQRNLSSTPNVDIVQCSIDRPPIKPESIELVMCHNVIQHTPSVEQTARALWRIVSPGGEFVFNCYPMNDQGLLRKARFAVYTALRHFLSKRSYGFLMAYARTASVLRMVPILGWALEKAHLMVRGDVPPGPRWFFRAYKAGVLNTFDCYGSHAYQHRKSDDEIRALVRELGPSTVGNLDGYFSRPPPIGIALRLFK
jgi:2-polyprenyl-3-methyl-5-hydroxy-6-metoxy-1,4-benzoquinol methylase